MDHSANYSLRASDKKLNIYYNMDKYILKIEVSHITFNVTYFNNVSSSFSKRLRLVSASPSRETNWHRRNMATNTTAEDPQLTVGTGTHITVLCVT
jgi:hypothetical protein